MRLLSFGFLVATLLPVYGIQLRVQGKVSGLFHKEMLADVSIQVHRNGEQQGVVRTGANGRYSIVLDDHSEYVLRFVKQGLVSKCYAIDTRGAAWQDDKRFQDLEIDIALFEVLPDLDLSFFDMPMGMARFNPMTGHVAWNADHERRVRPEIDRLMAQVAMRREVLVQRRDTVAARQRN